MSGRAGRAAQRSSFDRTTKLAHTVDADVPRVRSCATRNASAARPDCAGHLQYPAHFTYMQGVADQNISTLWSKVDANVLVVYGTSDFVTAAAEHEVIVDAVNRVRPGRARLVAVKDMDHFLNVRPSQLESLRASQAGDPRQGELHTGLGRELVYLPALSRVRAGLGAEPELEAYLERGRVSIAAARQLRALGEPPERPECAQSITSA